MAGRTIADQDLPVAQVAETAERVAGLDGFGAGRARRLDPARHRLPVERRAPADRGHPGRRQDAAGAGVGGVGRRLVPSHPGHARPAARRRDGHDDAARRQLRAALPCRARSSPTSSCSTSSIGPTRARSRRCSRRRRRAPSRSTGRTRELPSPFLLVATQNPVEMTGTYPLGEGALDRFAAVVTPGGRAPPTRSRC